ncbi:MAG: hypothetical protein KC519_18390, partial [Anaerolineae bacterium]|nr:hypothetical protein [Anaerolineae bacterium]
MSSVTAYSQVVQAVIAKEAWSETYFSLLSLKAQLQALPGWQRFDLWAAETEDHNVSVLIVTNWEYPEQLQIWLERGTTVDAVLRAVQPPPLSLQV